MDSIENQLILAQENNTLLFKTSELINSNDEQALISVITQLYHSKKIHIIDAILSLDRDNFIGKEYKFYLLTTFLDKLLSHLQIDLHMFMECSITIEKTNGISELCKNDQAKSELFFDLSLANLNKFAHLISTSIILFNSKTFNKRQEQLLAIIKDPLMDVAIKQQILYSFSKLSFIGKIKNIIPLLDSLEYLTDIDEHFQTYGNVLELLATLSVDYPEHEAVLTNLAEKIWKKPNDDIRDITSSLISNIKNLPNYLLDKIINEIIKFDLSDKNHLQTRADRSLEKLFEHNTEKASYLLNSILIKNAKTLSIESFQSTLYLISESEKLSNYLITKWLLSQEYELQQSCSYIINNRHNDDKTLSVDSSLLDLNKKNICLFLSEKACGWLFYSPTSVVSYVLSVLEHVKNKQEKELITNLLFNMLYLNYPMTLKDFFEKNMTSFKTKIKKIVSDLHIQYQQFQKENHIEKLIFELHPNISQREKYYKYEYDLNDHLTKKSEEGSIIEMIGKVTLLYGNSSLYQTYSISGREKELRETPINEYSYTTEMAALNVLDNSSLHLLLYKYRSKVYSI